jgi:hypothetical protein
LSRTSPLLALHEAWAWVVIIGNGLAGLWALGASRWPGLRTRALWWFTALVQVSVVVQATLGALVSARYHLKAPAFHIFYGVLAFITVAILYSYRVQMRHRLYLLYGFGGLFVMGLGIRAVLVGRA